MVISPLNLKLFREFYTMRGQFITLALVVGIGVALFFASWSCYNSLKIAESKFYTEYRFADLFAHVKRAPQSVLPRLQNIEGVLTLEHRLTHAGTLRLSHQDEPVIAHVVSYPQSPQGSLNLVHILMGSAPVGPSQILVHQAFAKAQGLRVGDKVEILLHGRLRRFEVSGVATSPEFVYALNPVAPLPDNLHFGVFWISYSALEEILGMSGSFNDLLFRLDTGVSVEGIKESIDHILKPYGASRARDRGQQLSAKLIADEIRQQRVMAVFMPTLFLIVAAFILNIIISRYMTLQRNQIGALKALGYSSNEVAWHYLKFVIMVVIVSTLPGLALGYYLGFLQIELYAKFFSFPEISYQPQGDAFFVSLVLALVCGLAGGALSIWRALEISPVEAMRPPTPEVFKGHMPWMDKQKIDQRFRMSLRNFLHHPIRWSLTIIGISTALALMVMALGWGDVLDYMIDGQFQKVQRENMSLSFAQPRTASVLNEIRQIKGIIKAEGSREVPVTLRFQSYKKDVPLIGVDQENNELRQIADRDFRPIQVRQDGLILSRQFQDLWGLQVGDQIEIERRDGINQVISLPVAGFADDIMGDAAYLDIHFLWRVLNEKPSYSSAQMLVDPLYVTNVYNRVSELPQVQSVNLKDIFLKGFMESVGGMINTFVIILTVFAVFMAIGVVYNAVRISFAERSWEFAGLRVLGFFPREVFSVLLFEFLLCMGLALIPGLWLGKVLTWTSLQMLHTESFRFPMKIYPASYGLSSLVMLASFALSLALAYSMVRRLKLVEALKARE